MEGDLFSFKDIINHEPVSLSNTAVATLNRWSVILRY